MANAFSFFFFLIFFLFYFTILYWFCIHQHESTTTREALLFTFSSTIEAINQTRAHHVSCFKLSQSKTHCNLGKWRDYSPWWSTLDSVASRLMLIVLLTNLKASDFIHDVVADGWARQVICSSIDKSYWLWPGQELFIASVFPSVVITLLSPISGTPSISKRPWRASVVIDLILQSQKVSE